MLPSINLAADFNSQDPKKQISALKSQMASLKDAIEDELNSISYFQLDGDLRKRIDGINDAVKASNENIEMVMGNLKANYATIASLDAAVARIGTIEAKYITADYVSANYASLGWVTALDAIVGNLNAKAITTDNLSAIQISASQITSGTISAARISTGSLSASKLTSQDGKGSASWGTMQFVRYISRNSDGTLNVVGSTVQGLVGSTNADWSMKV